MTNKFLEMLNDRVPRSTCSFIGTTAAILAGTLASVGGSVAGGLIGKSASKSAAQQQVDAANHAADMQYKAAQESNALQEKMFNKGQENLAPYLATGTLANQKLSDLLNMGYQGFDGKSPTFSAPKPFDPSKVQFDPGFQYRMDQSNKAIERFAAKSGTFLSGGTGMKLIRNAQDMTSQEYQNAYGRASGQQQVDYGQGVTDYQQQLQKYMTDYNVFANQRTEQYNQLAQAAGLGVNTTGQLNQLGSNFANTVGNTNLTTTTNAGNLLTGGANAAAAGIVGGANSTIGALTGAGNSVNQGLTLSMLLNANPGLLRNLSNQNSNQPGSLNPGYARR